MFMRYGKIILITVFGCRLVSAQSDVISTNAVLDTNDVEIAKAVKAMKVEEDESASKDDKQAKEAAEQAEIAEIVRKEEEKKAEQKAEPMDPWEAFAPPPDTEFDWIQLTSGEWLKGDFKVLYDYVIEFDSDEMDLQEFDFDDVKRLRTRGMKTVLIEGEGGPRDTTLLRGLLEINDNQVILRRSEHEVQVTRNKVISVADGRKRERDYWSGMLSVGINARGGNTETSDMTIMANLKRRTARSRFNADYLANYSSAADVETANNQRLSGFYDLFLTRKFYWQVLQAEYYRDPFSNIDNQYSVSTGAGYDIIHNSKTEWIVGAGAGYQQLQFVSVEAGEDDQTESPFGTLGMRFDHEVTGNLDFLYDYSMRVLNEDNGRYTHHMVTTLSFDLISDLDLDVSLIWDRVEKPQAAADTTVPKKDDYQLVVSLAYDF
jgi:putative salt-induced outer membrane protein YdiY